MLTRLALIGALALVLPTLRNSQAPAAAPQEAGPAVVVFANGGGGSPADNLNDAGTADFKTGWSVGGGAGIQINQSSRFVGYSTTSAPRARSASIAFAGQRFNNYFYGGDLQLRYPTASGLAPYLLPVPVPSPSTTKTTRPSNASPSSPARPGSAWSTPSRNTGAGIFLQGTSYIYKFDRDGFNKTQYDILWTAGLSYRFGTSLRPTHDSCHWGHGSDRE